MFSLKVPLKKELCGGSVMAYYVYTSIKGTFIMEFPSEF